MLSTVLFLLILELRNGNTRNLEMLELELPFFEGAVVLSHFFFKPDKKLLSNQTDEQNSKILNLGPSITFKK